MGVVILLASVTWIAVFILAWQSSDDISLGIFGGFGISLLIGAFALLMVASLSDPMSPQNLSKYDFKVTTYELKALNDDSSISGSFFLGSGNIEGKAVYNYIYENDGMYILNQINADSAYLVYSDVTPKIEKYEAQEFLSKKDKFWRFPRGSFYKIYIPEGTIKYSFVVDMQ